MKKGKARSLGQNNRGAIQFMLILVAMTLLASTALFNTLQRKRLTQLQNRQDGFYVGETAAWYSYYKSSASGTNTNENYAFPLAAQNTSLAASLSGNETYDPTTYQAGTPVGLKATSSLQPGSPFSSRAPAATVNPSVSRLDNSTLYGGYTNFSNEGKFGVSLYIPAVAMCDGSSSDFLSYEAQAPISIKNMTELLAISGKSGHFKLTQDIVLPSTGWSTVLLKDAVLDGGGFQIDGNAPGGTYLFDTTHAKITNLRVRRAILIRNGYSSVLDQITVQDPAIPTGASTIYMGGVAFTFNCGVASRIGVTSSGFGGSGIFGTANGTSLRDSTVSGSFGPSCYQTCAGASCTGYYCRFGGLIGTSQYYSIPVKDASGKTIGSNRYATKIKASSAAVNMLVRLTAPKSSDLPTTAVGGLVGLAQGGNSTNPLLIEDSKASGTIAYIGFARTTSPEKHSRGGLAGIAMDVEIRNSSATMTLGKTGALSSQAGAGGLVGSSSSSLKLERVSAYPTISLDPSDAVGGLVGLGSVTATSATNCAAVSAVTSSASNPAGALFGAASTLDVRNCFGSMSLSHTTARPTVTPSGTCTAQSVFTDRNVYDARCKTPAKSSSDLRLATTYSDWDFVSTWSIAPGEFPKLR